VAKPRDECCVGRPSPQADCRVLRGRGKALGLIARRRAPTGARSGGAADSLDAAKAAFRRAWATPALPPLDPPGHKRRPMCP